MRSELVFRRLIFFELLAIAPAFVFLGMAVLFEPPAAILATVLSLSWLITVAGENESLLLVAFFIAHFAVFAVLYWIVAFTVAKLVWSIKYRSLALLASIVSLLGIALMSQLSIYGGGGHGPTKVAALQEFINDDLLFIGGTLLSYAISVGIIGMLLICWAFLKTSSDKTEHSAP